MVSFISSLSYASDTATISVSATVLSRHNCKFDTNNATLNFGNLDSSNPIDRTVSTSIQFRCSGPKHIPVAFYISDDDGLYETGPDANRMRHTTISSEYLPYSFDLNPRSGNVPPNTWQPLTITGTVRVVDYQDAALGSYQDTVTITIEP